MVRRFLIASLFVALGIAVAPACGGGDGSGSSEELLQSSCVHDNIDLPRTVEDGEDCANFGYGDCPADEMASECVNYCAHDTCQAGPCSTDGDCEGFGANYECLPYVVDGDDYGTWCGYTDCPKGTYGCPCKEGKCFPPDEYWTLECVDGTCQGDDGCPSGCRVGSVCCGGALCSGNCIGTPCCS